MEQDIKIGSTATTTTKYFSKLYETKGATTTLYVIIFIGAGLRYYYIWVSPITDILGGLMLWSFYIPPLLGEPDWLTQFTLGIPAIQWTLPAIMSVLGIYLNRKKYLAVHLGLILLIAASLAIIFLRGVYVWSV